jgi:GTP pyrophosphokinase
VAGFFKLADVSALYAAVGEGTVGAQAVVNRLITVEGGDEIGRRRDQRGPGRHRSRQRSSGGDRLGIRVIWRDRTAGQAGEVLYPGARRSDHRAS